MERIIRILIAIARFIENAAERVREAAIDRLEQHKDKARAARDKAVQASMDEWERENRKHKARLKEIQARAMEAEEQYDLNVQADEEKIKRISLT